MSPEPRAIHSSDHSAATPSQMRDLRLEGTVVRALTLDLSLVVRHNAIEGVRLFCGDVRREDDLMIYGGAS